MRSASARSSGGISAILASRSCSPPAPFASLTRSLIAARSSAVKPLLLPAVLVAVFFAAVLCAAVFFAAVSVVLVLAAVAFFAVVGMGSLRGHGRGRGRRRGLSGPFSKTRHLGRFSKPDQFWRILAACGDDGSRHRRHRCVPGCTLTTRVSPTGWR